MSSATDRFVSPLVLVPANASDRKRLKLRFPVFPPPNDRSVVCWQGVNYIAQPIVESSREAAVAEAEKGIQRG